jgi:hypothetical protein
MNERYQESYDMYMMAYKKSSVKKSILPKLVDVAIKLEKIQEALDFYYEFEKISPNDNTKYILKYKIFCARKAPAEELIAILEEYKDIEYTERWSYELAKLYYEVGDKEKCLDTCDDLCIWFRDGKYVIKCLELKQKIRHLTPTQQKIYDNYKNRKSVSKPETKTEVEEPKKEETKTEEIKTEEKPEEILQTQDPVKPEEKIEEEEIPIFQDNEEFHQKVSEGIKDIFKKERASDEEEENTIEILKTRMDLSQENRENIPSLEPEKTSEDDPESGDFPKFEMPKVDFNEAVKVENLQVEEKLGFNLEDTILASAAQQGIKLPDSVEEEKTEEEDFSEQEETKVEEEADTLTEEEKLMKFIDEQQKDPDLDEMEILPREDQLDEDELKMFKYFSSVPGMKEQLVETLKDNQKAAEDKTSKTGNVIIMGNPGCGKTSLAEFLVKASCRQLQMTAAKFAKVHADSLKGKNIAKIVDQLSGGFLLIQEANKLDGETVEELNQAMDFRTDGLTIILEDEKIGMRKFIARNPKFIEKFTSNISIPVFTNDELVEFAKVYTKEIGYRINEMGILALYALISDNQKEDEPMTVANVKIFVDNAIAKAESGARKLQRNLSKTRKDHDGFIVLYEKDFK